MIWVAGALVASAILHSYLSDRVWDREDMVRSWTATYVRAAEMQTWENAAKKGRVLAQLQKRFGHLDVMEADALIEEAVLDMKVAIGYMREEFYNLVEPVSDEQI